MRLVLLAGSRSVVRSAVLAAAALGIGTAAHAVEMKIQTTGHRFFADVGESGGNFDASAVITVVVTHGGLAVADLGASVALNPAGISLPAGWTLNSSFVAPPGPLGLGCVFSPTEFTNRGGGIYTIRVAPFLGDPVCRWGLGDYHYVVRIVAKHHEANGLGVLTIPDSPSVP